MSLKKRHLSLAKRIVRRLSSPPVKKPFLYTGLYAAYDAYKAYLGKDTIFKFFDISLPKKLSDIKDTVTLNHELLGDAVSKLDLYVKMFPYAAEYLGVFILASGMCAIGNYYSRESFYHDDPVISAYQKKSLKERDNEALSTKPLDLVESFIDSLGWGYSSDVKKLISKAEKNPRDVIALENLVSRLSDDLEDGKGAEENSLGFIMDYNLQLCKAWDNLGLAKVLFRDREIARYHIHRNKKKVRKNPESILARQNLLRVVTMSGGIDDFCFAFDSAIGLPLKKDERLILSHKHLTDDILEEYSKYTGDEALSMDYLNYLVDIAHHFAGKKPSDLVIERRDKALELMYRVAKKREDRYSSDFERFGESKNLVVSVKRGQGISDIVFKEGEHEDLRNEMHLTFVIKDILKDYPRFDVPKPLSVLEVPMGFAGESYDVYAMEREEGETLQEKIEKNDPGVEGYLRDVVELIAVLHSEVPVELIDKGPMNLKEYNREKLQNPELSLDESLINTILENYEPITASLTDSPFVYNGDCHPENFHIAHEKIIKLDNQNNYLVPAQFDLVNLLTYNFSKNQSPVEEFLDLYFKIYNRLSPSKLKDYSSFKAGYYNSILHRALSFTSAWSSDDRIKMKMKRGEMVDQAIMAIDQIEREFNNYFTFYERDYTALKDSLSQIKFSII